MGRLNGKVAIVTGGGQGVGLGIAQVFAREGARILITGRTPDKLEAAVADLRASGGEADWIAGTAGVRGDAEAAAARAVKLFGGIDILVNNAQTSRPGVMFEDTDDALFALTIESGLYGTFQHMQAVLPHMKHKGGGSIINFGSYEGIHGGVGFGAYAAAKEAIRGLSRTAARELGKFKIRVNVICPAALSPIAEQWVKDFPEEAEKVMKLVSLGHLGDCAEDIGPAAMFLASDDSRYVTGQTINVDGGQMML